MNPCSIPFKPTIRIPTMQNEVISVLKGNASAIKSKISDHPKAALTGGILFSGLSMLTYSLSTGNADEIQNAMQTTTNTVSRVGLLHTHEALMALDLIEEAATTVDYKNLISENGLFAGSILSGIGAVDSLKMYYDSLDKYSKNKVLVGAFFIPLLAVGMGCIGQSGGSPEPTTNPTSPNTEYPAQTSTPNIESKPEIIPTSESAEEITDWIKDHPTYHYTEIHSDLFDKDIEMYANERDMAQGIYNGFDAEGNIVFSHQEFPHFDPYDDLQPEQARELEARYGEAKTVIMEQADTDGNGQLDTVAVRYVGSKGTLEFETEFIKGATLSGYIRHNL